MGLQAAIEAIQDIMLLQTGIREAPDYPPDSINVYPTAICYASSGEWTPQSDAWKKGIHTITLQVHWARKDLPRDIAKAMALVETIPNALCGDPKLAGTVDTIISITYTFGTLEMGNVQNVGFDFKIRVKIQSAIT